MPRGLSTDQWQSLLKDHELPNGEKSGSPHYGKDHGIRPVNSLLQEWNVIIINATDKPALVNVSRDFEHGPGADESRKAVLNLPSVDDLASPMVAMNQLSPSEDEYFALQLARLSRGLPPVDMYSWTFANRIDPPQIGKYSWMFNWSQDHLMVSPEHGSYYDLTAMYSSVSGVRPTVRIGGN